MTRRIVILREDGIPLIAGLLRDQPPDFIVTPMGDELELLSLAERYVTYRVVPVYDDLTIFPDRMI